MGVARTKILSIILCLMKVAVFGSGHMPSLVAIGKKGRGISITGANTLLSSHHYVFVVVVVGFFA